MPRFCFVCSSSSCHDVLCFVCSGYSCHVLALCVPSLHATFLLCVPDLCATFLLCVFHLFMPHYCFVCSSSPHHVLCFVCSISPCHVLALCFPSLHATFLLSAFQKFPNEGLTTVVNNVFAFDQYNKELKETLVETMQKHGIPLGASEAAIRLAKE